MKNIQKKYYIAFDEMWLIKSKKSMNKTLEFKSSKQVYGLYINERNIKCTIIGFINLYGQKIGIHVIFPGKNF